MKKISVAVLIVGTFVIYSLIYRQSNGVASIQTRAADSGAVASRVTPAAAGAASRPPTQIVTGDDDEEAPRSTAAVAQPTAPPAATTPSTGPSTAGAFKDGSYTGSVADAQWGYIQVKAVVSQGHLTDVQFLQYPNDRSRSVFINRIADPMLTSEAIQAQGAQVDIISGATDSSEAFMQSLSDALSQAQS